MSTRITALEWRGRLLWQLVYDDGFSDQGICEPSEEWKVVPQSQYSHRLGRPPILLDRLSDVDWSMNNNDIARKLNVTPNNVRYWRLRLTNVESDGYRRKAGLGEIDKVDWEWTTDMSISRQLHISRERARQLRMMKGKPCRFNNIKQEHLDVCKWILQHKDELDGKPSKEAVNLVPSSLPRDIIRRLLYKSGIKLNPHSRTKGPELDYRLPNSILSSIWNIPPYRMANWRCINRKGNPSIKWMKRTGGPGFSFDSGILEPWVDISVSYQIAKAKSSGITVNETDVWSLINKYRSAITNEHSSVIQPSSQRRD